MGKGANDRNMALETLERLLGYRFNDQSLLRTALINPSYRSTHPEISATQDNQRLEFLGDAVLGLLSAEQLYSRYQGDREGSLSQLRSHLVSGRALAQLARRIGLGPYLLLGKGETLRAGREHDKYLTDAVEAIFGAIWIDGGWPAVSSVYAFLKIGQESVSLETLVQEENPKGALQMFVQKRGLLEAPTYALVSSEGPEHAPEFTVCVMIANGMSAEGRGRSKHAAEVDAARQLLRILMKSDEEETGKDQPC